MVAVLKAGAAVRPGVRLCTHRTSWMFMHSKRGFTGMANESTRHKAWLLPDVILKLEGAQA